MAETNENIQDLVEQITCKMLLNDAEFNYLDNKDENQKAKRKKIHDEKKEEINEVIKALCSVVEKQLPPGIAAPAGLNVLIARRMLFEMKDGKDATKEFANLDAKTILNDFKIAPVNYREQNRVETVMMVNQEKDILQENIIRNEEISYFKDVSNFPNLSVLNTSSKEDVQNFIDQVHKNGGLVDERGINIVIRDEETSNDKYTEEENLLTDIIAMGAEKLMKAYRCTDPEDRQKELEEFEDFAKNSGAITKADSRMQMLSNEINRFELDYNGAFVMQNVDAWAVDFQEEGYNFDAHSAGNVLVFLGIVEQECDEENKKKIFETIEKTCPEVFHFYEKNPNVIDAILAANVERGDFVSDMLLDGKPSGSVEELIQGIEKFKREHSQEDIDKMAEEWRESHKKEEGKSKDILDNEPAVDRSVSQDDTRDDLEIVEEQENTLPGLDEQEEIKQPEVEQERPEPERDKTQLTMAEKMENVKKNIIDIAKAKGATAALKFANNLIMNRSGEEREAITASVIEVVSRDEFIETAKEDDLGTIREIIGGCLDEDNKKQNPQLIDYVQALGGVSKDIKSRIKAQEMTVEEGTKSIGAQQPSRDDDEPEL